MMKIIGNGVDIVKNSRIRKLISNKKFVERIYSRTEINFSKKILNKESYFAKRFAAKEAFVKSLGTGFRNGINFKDISIVNTSYGKPRILLNNKIKKIIDKKLKLNKFKIFLSLSDEKKYSIAFVILNKN
tara:strand:+ start:433 stop:822 length:390 start_codon:yes stop_codon:yes gene_type:complete